MKNVIKLTEVSQDMVPISSFVSLTLTFKNPVSQTRSRNEIHITMIHICAIFSVVPSGFSRLQQK